VLRPAGIGIEHPHPRQQHGHFRHGEGQGIGLIDHHLRRGQARLIAGEVAEGIGCRTQLFEALGVGVRIGCIDPARGEGHGDGVARSLGRIFHRNHPAEHDEIGDRDLLGARFAVEAGRHAFQRLHHLGDGCGIVHAPVLLRSEPDARAVGTAAHVGITEGDCRCPCGAHQFRARKPGLADRVLQRGDIAVVDHGIVSLGQRVLPDQVFGGTSAPT
jgi:hypothetical protein